MISLSPAKKTFFRILKHPLLIAAIASWLIPGIIERSNARAARNKTRIEQAMEMINASASVNSLLNKMKTEFESFEKDSLGASPEDYRKLRDGLRDRVHSLHSDFNGLGWWWPWTISYRVKALDLVSDDNFIELQSLINKYIENLTAASKLFEEPRKHYLPAAAPIQTAGQEIMPGLDERFQDLQTKRDNLVRQMAALEINNPAKTRSGNK
ncbi:MAG: hypothetical protein V7609_865 [Verrucomicrobiota bacterium]